MTPGQGLRSLFDPASVAVVGASADPAKWGYWLASGALAGRGRRRVHLVNQRGGALDGVPFHPSLDSLPDAPEHVVVATPPGAVRAVVADGLARGARCFTVITSAVADERELAELVRANGARLLGPNCMGVVDTGSQLRLSWGDFPRGDVGLVSQSGNLALEIGRLLQRSGQGFSRFVSLGNQRDIDATDAIEALVDHEPTRLIAAYVEDFRDGRRFARALARARAAGKPVLLLTVGRSEASGRAAASHTDALVSALSTVDAACRDAGALRLDSAGELVDTALVLLAPRRPAGRRVRIAGDSGGQGALAADALAARGLVLPALPLDLAGAGEADLHSYARVAADMLAAHDTDLALLTGYFGDYATGNPAQADEECAVARELADAAADSGRPLLVHTMARDTPALAVLRERGVPVFERVEQAAAAAAHAARWSAASAHDPLPLPPPTATLGDGGYESVRAALIAAGIAFPDARFVTTEDESVRAAAALGGPVALKAMGLAHKTEAGGVVLNLRQPGDVREAFRTMRQRTGAARYAVEAMAPQRGVELILGVRRDPAFGPVVLVGIGGTTAELLADTAVALAPVTQDQARALILSLRHAPLLTGWRGSPALAVDAAAEALSLLSHLAPGYGDLTDIEINPLLVHEEGAIALDAAALVTDRSS
ncbi:acetate--CoA ligase family protein [Streptacidiphilus monticola]|uniref:Acetate--CoA ligase family protein n=1 Tax=Streptacidiphilus monticola TaxID=2161674 RepID=A0ABW1G2W6_9ACTN